MRSGVHGGSITIRTSTAAIPSRLPTVRFVSAINCGPAGPQLIADTKRTVGSREGIAAVEVRIVMDPPWTPDRMTDAARDQLGIF